MPINTQTYIQSQSTVNPVGQLVPAGGFLSGHRVVCVVNGTLVYADNTDLTHAVRPVGLTTATTLATQPAEIVWTGRIVEPSWTWTQDLPVFLGTSGLLTQTKPTAPAAAYLRYIGTADSATSIVIAPQPPVLF